MAEFTPNAARFWRDLGPAARDVINLHDLRTDKGAKSATLTPVLPRGGWYEGRLAH